MADRDPFTQLCELARVGEQHAEPLAASLVRARGTQRRRRRHALVAAAVAVVAVVAGGTALSGTGLSSDGHPAPVASSGVTALPTATDSPYAGTGRSVTAPATDAPSAAAQSRSAPPSKPSHNTTARAGKATASKGTSGKRTTGKAPATKPPTTTAPSTTAPPPARILSPTDLIDAAEVPLGANHEAVVVSDPDVGRKPNKLSACQAGSATDLGATEALPRNFGPGRLDSPTGRLPEIYTLTLQFDDATQAAKAEATYTGWLVDCASTLDADGYRMLRPKVGDSLAPITVNTGSGQGRAYDLVYSEPGEPSESGTFENVGLLVVDDRLLIMVRVVQGQDDNAYYWGDNPVEGLGKHPFYAMMSVAAKKLA